MYDIFHYIFFFFFFKQKTAYEMRISDWSSDVCSSDLNSLNIDSCAPCLKIKTATLLRHGAQHILGHVPGKHLYQVIGRPMLNGQAHPGNGRPDMGRSEERRVGKE